MITHVKHGKGIIRPIEPYPVPRIDIVIMQSQPFMRCIEQGKRETKVNNLRRQQSHLIANCGRTWHTQANSII